LLNEFKIYSIQDAVSLLEALINAQNIYYNDFYIDITSVLSTSTLSLKIFRSGFLKHEIPILNNKHDSFIRKSYFGGATDYYKAYGTNVYHYDINSLYPFAMMKPMPHEIIREHKNINQILTKDFNLFGFFEVECYSPEILKPLFPYKQSNKTIYPYGNWKGIYFSEELKVMLNYGYQFKIIRGYEFSKIDLFSEYVNYFYNIKKKFYRL
jgi:hypothetical protein